MTNEQIRQSNKRILRYALIVSLCIMVLVGTSFLLILALERRYNGDLTPLMQDNPRAATILWILLSVAAITLIAFLVFLIRARRAWFRAMRQRRRIRRRKKREAKALSRGKKVRYSRKDRKDMEEERQEKLRRERFEAAVARKRGAMINEALKEKGIKTGSSRPADNELVSAGVAHRFPTLSAYDEAHPAFEMTVSDPGLTLRGMCEGFRQYAAGVKGLYYSPSDVASFLASLSASHTMILQGMSGTGKTSLPIAFGEFLGSPTVVVPVQPTWKERSDILGYFNEFTGRYSESEFLKALYEAGGGDSPRLIVLDEANIARVEYYFAEFLSLLELPERGKRRVSAAPSGMDGDPRRMRGGSMLLPPNVWFVMTANNDDSTFAFSDKVYDRASVIDLDRRAEPFEAAPRPGVRVGLPDLERLFDEACLRYGMTARDERRVARLDAFLRSAFGVSFGNRVYAQMRRYVPAYAACGLPPLEALDQLLARKVLRKLGSANPVLVRSRSGELLSLLAELFGEGGAPMCEASIRRIADNG